MTKTIDLTEPVARFRHWQISGIWTAETFVYAVALHGQAGVPFVYALATSAVYYYSLAALMIPVSKFASRVHSSRTSSVSTVARHLAIGCAVLLVWQTIVLIHMRLAVG